MYDLKQTTKDKIEKTKEILKSNNLYYTEKPNGQFIVDGVNYWCTSEKWLNPKTKINGVGINSFLMYIRKELIK